MTSFMNGPLYFFGRVSYPGSGKLKIRLHFGKRVTLTALVREHFSWGYFKVASFFELFEAKNYLNLLTKFFDFAVKINNAVAVILFHFWCTTVESSAYNNG